MAELWRTQWSPLRKAVEDSDHAGVIAAVAAKSQMTAAGCWEWQGKRSTTRGGGSPYPAVKLGKVNAQVHRLVLEAKHGAALGSQTAHHMCANTICVNPDHLQPVTHRDNIAEMLARHSYLARIEELEAALAVLNPTHELLKVIAVA